MLGLGERARSKLGLGGVGVVGGARPRLKADGDGERTDFVGLRFRRGLSPCKRLLGDAR